jgi:NAD(P)-dependent dehydrogenase (short-subunit alcohol dehydrogenase family)
MTAKADLTGKVAVIAGGASGIGLALALHAAEQGMKVALADVDECLLAAALEQVNARDVAAITVRTDVSDVNAVRTLARRTEAELGPPWLLCNHSGVSTFGVGRKLSPTDLKSVTDINLWGIINGVQVFAPGMAKRDAGNIVNVASATAMYGIPGTAPYVATIHAILGLSESLYRELDAMGSQVGVTVVCPDPMNTNVTSATRDRTGARQAEQTAHSVPSLARDVPLNVLPPDELAEQIFAAIAARRFQVFPHARPVRELSRRLTCRPTPRPCAT